MKIVFCRWNSICEKGITNAFRELGIDTVMLDRRFSSVDYDNSYVGELSDLLNRTPDAGIVFSVNFIPVIARVCRLYKLPYFSWIVDSPCFQLYSETVAYGTNRIFCFDRSQYERFRAFNEEGFFYLTLGADVGTYDRIEVSEEEHRMYDCKVSFIGSLYSEKCRYNQVEERLPDYLRGFCEGLFAAQEKVFGYNFLEDVITDDLAEAFKEHAGWRPLGEDYREDRKAIVADTFLGEKCTELERIHTLNAIAGKYPVDLYTLSDTSLLKGVNIRGGADSSTMMPKIVKCSRINLNMTRRPIRTGLPLRIFDLMGMGGFVISNYQEEIPEYFISGEDIVLYESISHLLELIGYYLDHDEERTMIAQNGYQKVKEHHTYAKKIMKMLEMAANRKGNDHE